MGIFAVDGPAKSYTTFDISLINYRIVETTQGFNVEADPNTARIQAVQPENVTGILPAMGSPISCDCSDQ